MNQAMADLDIQVVQRDSMVIALFSRRMSDDGERKAAATDNLTLSPTAAMNMAELLTAMAFEADTGLKPVSDSLKPALVEAHRQKLTPRVRQIITSGVNAKKLPQLIAKDIIDSVFSEIFS